MSNKTVRYEATDGVATVTLHRPDKLNAFTRGMAAELLDAFERIDGDDAVRAVIVTGSGRAFCAGADLSPEEHSFDFDRLPDTPVRAMARSIIRRNRHAMPADW